MRINGWQRIGIVLSVIWLAGFLAYYWQNPLVIVDNPIFVRFTQCEQNYKEEFGAARIEGDITEKGITGNPQKGEEDRWKAVAKYWKCNTRTILAIDFALIIAGWLIAGVGVNITRWIRAGFA